MVSRMAHTRPLYMQDALDVRRAQGQEVQQEDWANPLFPSRETISIYLEWSLFYIINVPPAFNFSLSLTGEVFICSLA